MTQSDQTDGVSDGPVPEEFLREVHGFLALEAPFLIRGLPQVENESELERVLVERLGRRYQLGGKFSEESLYPNVQHNDAAGWNRVAVEGQIRGFFERRRIKLSISNEERLELLRRMLLTRALDQHLKAAFDQKSVKWENYPSPQKGFRSTGQEAIVGACLRLRKPPEHKAGPAYDGDVIAPLIRDLGALLMFMPDPLHPILVQYGKSGTPVGGRDLHLGDFESGVLPPAAPLAIATQTLVGIAQAMKVEGQGRVCVSFIGDGGSSLGEWHEAVNFAAVRDLPLVFVIENNLWALGTHVSEQTRAKRFSARAQGYGIPGVTLFGNDPEEVAAGVTWAADRAREGKGPALIELVTYRRPGHAHHDDVRFHGNPEARVPGYEVEAERQAWEAVDPVELYEERLRKMRVLTPKRIDLLHQVAEREVEEAVQQAESAPWPEPSDYENRVFAPSRSVSVSSAEPLTESDSEPESEPADEFESEAGADAEESLAESAAEIEETEATPVATKRMSYDEAVRQALIETMEEDEGVMVLGEDVGGRYGGAFGVTRGLMKRFGEERCMNTPLAESAIVGCGVGAALSGMRPVVEIQFADFLAPGFNALVNNAAKIHWRWGRPVPLVVRLPYGGATGTMNRLLGGGPFHSQCPEMWFLRVPGWKIVAPSTPADAKALMIAAIRDDNPVIFLEAKGLYGFFRDDLREEVALGTEHEASLGEAAIRRAGEDLTILTYGAMAWTALEAAETLAEESISAEVIDLRSLVPLDEETIGASLGKTNRVLILHEDSRRGGVGGELAALITEKFFYHLDAPIRRVAAPDTPVPYSPPLEYNYLPKAEDVVVTAQELVRE